MLQGDIGPGGELYLSGRVHLPGLNFDEEIQFLVDTGADSTCIGPEFLEAAGVEIGALGNFEPCKLHGIGGSADGFDVPGLLVFDDGEQEYRYPVNVTVPAPQLKKADEDDVPIGALLGLDILRQWRMTYDSLKGVLTFDAPPQAQRIP